ncbi:MAG: 4Fe-4S dicluster domain-containing protein [Pseudomonadota bacterium]
MSVLIGSRDFPETVAQATGTAAKVEHCFQRQQSKIQVKGDSMAKLLVHQLYQYLPRTDCRKCGFSCMGFARRLHSRDSKPEDCPFLLEPEYSESLTMLNKLLGPEVDVTITGLIIDPEKCNGCGICVNVCEVNVEKSKEVESGRGPGFSDDVVLRIDDGKVNLVDPQSCRRLNTTFHICRACAELCPTKAITIA